MMKIKTSRAIMVSIVLLGSLVLGGCSLVAQPANVQTENPLKTYTGVISGVGVALTIKTDDGKLIEVTSRKLDLTKYEGKPVTVTGEFSGTTLFVDTVK